MQIRPIRQRPLLKHCCPVSTARRAALGKRADDWPDPPESRRGSVETPDVPSR